MRAYNKEEIFKTLDNLSIERNGDIVTTSFYGRVIKTAVVSNRYEVFDVVSYIKNKIETIEKNFEILKYDLYIRGGVQSLKLISDTVEISGNTFYKTFFILNSTDRSRKLNFSIGLTSTSNDFYMVAENASLIKKHYKGVTDAAEEASLEVDAETFEDQINNIKELVGNQISLSKVREVILGDKEDVPDINHKKFDAFKNNVRYRVRQKLTNEQYNFLFTESKRIKEVPKNVDFFMDAFWVFKSYLSIFNRKDAHIVRNETERIMKMTQWAIRNAALEALGI